MLAVSEIPVCPTSALEAELDEAARTERFEKAAELRDKIRAIKEGHKE
ncbi:MAG: UvrB/UvrC motif-containing protein [Nanoarchaeota archaeon]